MIRDRFLRSIQYQQIIIDLYKPGTLYSFNNTNTVAADINSCITVPGKKSNRNNRYAKKKDHRC